MAGNMFAEREKTKKQRSGDEAAKSPQSKAERTPDAAGAAAKQAADGRTGKERSAAAAVETAAQVAAKPAQAAAAAGSRQLPAKSAKAAGDGGFWLKAEPVERKTVTVTFLLTESLNVRIDKATKAGGFRSRNAMINALLDEFLPK